MTEEEAAETTTVATRTTTSKSTGEKAAARTLIRPKSLAFVYVLSVLGLSNTSRIFHQAHYAKDADIIEPWQLASRQTRLDKVSSVKTEKESFAACLLTKDDSHFLIEWLAYHYHTLPLRHLIVAVDPTSNTSPSFIFEKWRKHGLMTIDEVTDANFIFDDTIANRTGTLVHRYRQRQLYKHCIKSFKDANRTWVLFIDVDEYLSFNKDARINTSMTDLHKPATFSSFLKDQVFKSIMNTTIWNLQSPCIMIPRLRYGSVESTPEEVDRDVPQQFNGTAFQTMRYRKHGHPRANHINGPGKTIIDISRIARNEMNGSLGRVHRPVSSCTRELYHPLSRSPFVVRHYLGSEDQFFFRADNRQENGEIISGRKSQKTYAKFRDLHFGIDDTIRTWIEGFVEDVGVDVAIELLDGVGDVSIAPPMKH